MSIGIAIDFETSGYTGNSACAIGMARIRDLQVENTFYSLIQPPSPQVYFTEIHGITWEDLKDKPRFAELWLHIAKFINGADFFIAHNAPFDKHVLYASCEANGIIPPSLPFLCTLKGSQRHYKFHHNRLCDICSYLDIPLNHHNAASDALAAGYIFIHLMQDGLSMEAMLTK